MPKLKFSLLTLLILLLWRHGTAQLTFCGKADNDLYRFLLKEGLVHERFDSPEAAIGHAAPGSGVLILARSA